MSNIDLYKFITENSIEWRWELNDEILDVIIFVHCFDIAEFNKLLPDSIFDDDGIVCWMKDGYFAFWMNSICDYCGIDIEEIFTSTKDKERLILLQD